MMNDTEKRRSNDKEDVTSEKETRSEVETTGDRLQVPLYNAHVDISGVDEKKLMRKLDLYLIPWLSFLYLLSE
jgi:hypothetical protein